MRKTVKRQKESVAKDEKVKKRKTKGEKKKRRKSNNLVENV